jgi:hypothetical protein
MTNADDTRSRCRLVLDLVKRLLSIKPTPPPGDPYAYVTAPLRRGPKGRSGTAVAEIDEDSFHSFPQRS